MTSKAELERKLKTSNRITEMQQELLDEYREEIRKKNKIIERLRDGNERNRQV